MTHNNWTILTCGLLLALALAGGCQSAHNPASTGAQDAPTAYEEAAAARRATDSFVPTALPGYCDWSDPVATLRETTPAGGMIPGTPRELLARETSTIPTVVVNGADYDIDLPWNNVLSVETAVRLSPDWTSSASGNAGLALALYRLGVADFTGDPIATLAWAEPPAEPGDAWLGLGNLATDCWDWFSAADPAMIELGSLVPYTSNDDQVLAAVVLIGTDSGDLDWIRLGGPQLPDVVLTATPETGHIPLEVFLDASASSDSDGEITGFAWDLDNDGIFETDSGLEATRTINHEEMGVYYYSVQATDDEGNRANDIVMVSATSPFNQAPAADLAASPASGVVPLTVSLSAALSEDPDGEIISYEWDWTGDGTYEQLTAIATTSHLYSETGTYNPVVRVTDNEYATDTATIEVSVYAEPSAVLTVEPLTGHAPQGLDFDASQSELPGSDVDYFDWDFDGDGAWDATTTVPYAQYGEINEVEYASRLQIRNSAGIADTTTLDPPLEVLGWSRSYGGEYSDFCNAVCADGLGMIIAGAGTGSFGTGSYDGLLIKYNAGGDFQWARTWGGTAKDYLADIVTGPANNIFISGYTWSFAPGGYDDTFVAKFDQNGNLKWSRTWGRSSYDWLNDMTVDALGNVYAVGETPNEEYSSQEDFIVLKYDNNGNLLWSRTFDASRDDTYPFITLDNTGNLLVTGRSVVYPYGIQCSLVTISPAGELLSQYHWGGGNQDGFYRCCTDGDGAIYITGFTRSFGDSDGDALLVKLDASGELAWARSWGIEDTGEATTAAHVGADGLIYACGIHEDSVGAYYGFLLIINPEGDLIEARKLATTGVTRLWDGFSIGDETFVLAGSTIDAYGTWLDFPAIYVSAEAAVLPMEGELIDAPGTESSPLASSQTPDGATLNTGGGDLDGLIITYRTPAAE